MFGKFNQTLRRSSEYFKLTNLDLGGNFHLKEFSSLLPAQKLIHPYRSRNGSAQFLTTKPKNKISRPDRLDHWEYPQYCQFEHNSPYLLVKIFSSAPICKWRKPQVLLFLSQQRRGILGGQIFFLVSYFSFPVKLMFGTRRPACSKPSV